MSVSTEKVYGLIGFPLSHSFSKKYFSEKFLQENVSSYKYELFPLPTVDKLPQLIASHPNLAGLNVTIPHKQAVIPLLDEMDAEAASVGAVNVVQLRDGKLKGYNSDVFGFEGSLRKFLSDSILQKSGIQALVLGTGGASKAVVFVLGKMKIPFQYVSRSLRSGVLTYDGLTSEIISKHQLIINCTPLGTYPNVGNCPNLPYEAVTENHFFYDLVYNPAETLFLKKAKTQGAKICNGLEMLHLQAERSWEIWNEEETNNKQ